MGSTEAKKKNLLMVVKVSLPVHTAKYKWAYHIVLAGERPNGLKIVNENRQRDNSLI